VTDDEYALVKTPLRRDGIGSNPVTTGAVTAHAALDHQRLAGMGPATPGRSRATTFGDRQFRRGCRVYEAMTLGQAPEKGGAPEAVYAFMMEKRGRSSTEDIVGLCSSGSRCFPPGRSSHCGAAT
jgi:hypothetical protein